jgi:hypothetical protein
METIPRVSDKLSCDLTMERSEMETMPRMSDELSCDWTMNKSESDSMPRMPDKQLHILAISSALRISMSPRLESDLHEPDLALIDPSKTQRTA